MPVSKDWVPSECLLPTQERPLRVAEFDDLFGFVQRAHRAHATRLDLVMPAAVDEAARALARRESKCCSFFTFELDGLDDGVVMRIGVPAARVAVLDAVEARVRAK